MKLIALELNPTAKQLRMFGFIALVAFGWLGAVIYWKGTFFGITVGEATRGVALTLWGMGALTGVFSVVYPRANRPLFVALTFITYPIGYVVSHIIMALLFYGVITPVAVLFRLLGRDPLTLRNSPDAESYWETHVQRKDKKSYFRQF